MTGTGPDTSAEIEQVPAETKQVDHGVMVAGSVERSVEFYAGPLPPPADLQAYGEISSDLPHRIVSMAESSLAYRQAMDRGHSKRSSTGLAAGFMIAVLFMAAAAWLINGGSETAGVILGSIDLVALTAVFVLGHRNGRQTK